jgi:hypothetical protein
VVRLILMKGFLQVLFEFITFFFLGGGGGGGGGGLLQFKYLLFFLIDDMGSESAFLYWCYG